MKIIQSYTIFRVVVIPT